MKLDVGSITFKRRVVQILSIIVFGEFYSEALSSFRTLFYMIIQQDFSFSKIKIIFVPVILLTVLCTILGRVFCGWFCVFGTLNEFLFLISNKFLKIKYSMMSSLSSKFKYLKYMVLVFMAIFISIYGIETAYYHRTSIGRIIAILIIAGIVIVERFFCKYICPLGAIQAIISKVKLSTIDKPIHNCNKCKLCSTSCPMGINLDKMEKVKDIECIGCLACVTVCPSKNAKLGLGGRYYNYYVYIGAAVIIFAGFNIINKLLFRF